MGAFLGRWIKRAVFLWALPRVLRLAQQTWQQRASGSAGRSRRPPSP